MSRYKLYRCAICKKFGAYIIPKDGKGYICYRCWYAQWKTVHPDQAAEIEEPDIERKDN